MQIIPAILEQEKDKFLMRCEELEKIMGVEKIQVDFCDGRFVNNTSLTIQEIDVLNPMLSWEAHLMVEDPVDFFDYKMVGFGTVIVHFESFTDKSVLTSRLREIQKLGLQVGLAIKPETDPKDISGLVTLLDQVTILSIHPGRQGTNMLQDAPEHISFIRSLYPDLYLEVDGGVNADNIMDIHNAGANAVVVGSALKGETEQLFNILKDVISL